VISQGADGLFQAGLAGSVLFNPDRNASPLAIASGFALLLLPYSVIGPYVGVFLDRWSRRTVVFLTNVLRAGLVVPGALMIYFGSEGPLFALVAFAIIGLNRFFLSGLSAATPHVVADRRLVTANAISGTLGSIAFSAGLGVAAVLVNTALPATFHGYAVVAGLAPLGYLASGILAQVSYRRDELGPDAVERPHESILTGIVTVSRGMVDGIRHLARQKGAVYLVLAQAGHRGCYGVLTLATLLLYRNYFTAGSHLQDSTRGLAMVFASASLGVLLAAFVTPPVARRIGGWRWVAYLLGSAGVVLLAFALPFKASLLLVAVFYLNLTSQSIKIVVDTALQHECADEYRGRVFSVNDTSFNLALVAGLFAGALTLPDNGRSIPAIGLIALGYAALAAWYAIVGGAWARRVGDDIAQPEGERTAVG
jgi:MFS family permease